jgi:hypothetical protein
MVTSMVPWMKKRTNVIGGLLCIAAMQPQVDGLMSLTGFSQPGSVGLVMGQLADTASYVAGAQD